MALGRGLSSLIQPKDASQQQGAQNGTPSSHQETMFYIAIDQIDPNPLQPRKEFDEAALQDLASSIKESGILQPILVMRAKSGTAKVPFQILTGERRWRAAKLAGLKEVPALIRNVANDQENLRIAILENVQRENLNPIELAQAYKKLVDEFHMDQESIGKKVGKSRQVVGNTMRLLTLPVSIQDDVKNEVISENHARAILALPTDDMRLKLWKEIKDLKLSARHAEVAARKFKQTPSRAVAALDAETKQMAMKLEAHLGTKVTIEPGKHVSDGGKIVIKYFSNEDLRAVVKKIVNE